MHFFRSEPNLSFSTIKGIFWHDREVKVLGYSGSFVYVQDSKSKDEGYIHELLLNDKPLNIRQKYVNIYKGATKTGIVTINYDKNGMLEWSLSQSGIVEVTKYSDRSLSVKGLSPGTVKLTVECDGNKDTCDIACIEQWSDTETTTAQTSIKVMGIPGKEYKDAIYCIGSVVGPHPFPMMVRDFQSVVGIEAREQFKEMTGELPDAVVACLGGGSNAAGMFAGFLNDPVEIYGIEPLGRGTALGDHAASLQYGTEGVMHGFNSIMLKDENGEPAPVYSVASGLDYPSSGPEHAFLHEIGRVNYDVIGDDDTIDAFFKLSRLEGIIPAIESAHAVAYAIKLAKKMGKGSILINLSGRGDKDMDYIIENYGIPEK